MQSIIVIIYNILHNNNKSYEKSEERIRIFKYSEKKNYFYKIKIEFWLI